MAKSRHWRAELECPLYPQERTFEWPSLTSACDPERTKTGVYSQSIPSPKWLKAISFDQPRSGSVALKLSTSLMAAHQAATPGTAIKRSASGVSEM